MYNRQMIKLIANYYKRWLYEESFKTPLFVTHFVFEFRKRIHSLLSICMDPHSPNKLIATEYCFLILGDDYQLLFHYFIIFRFFVILCYFVIINFYKNFIIIIIILFYYYFFNEKLFLFYHVPGSSGMFRFPGFTDAHFKIESESQLDYHELPSAKQMLPLK